MKITHIPTGQQYQLTPDTELEIERTNPFFNEYGEQSLPVSIPDTPTNRKLTNQPHMLGNKNKPTKIPVKIEDGQYIMQATQAILNAKPNQPINTSFYMNEGSFYNKITNTLVKTIFADEAIPGINTVQQAIDFCNTLLTTPDERLTICPLLIDGTDTEKKQLNRLAWMEPDGTLKRPSPIFEWVISPSLYNTFPRSETINDTPVTIPAGYYITPFIKANYLLKRIFQYFGYTLQENFFTITEPFTKMAIINKTTDTIITGKIQYKDILPDCSCNTILNIFRKKFNCEFIPDESTQTITIKLFNDTITAKAATDLTTNLVEPINIDYVDNYKQLQIKSEETITDATTTYPSISELIKKHPTALHNPSDQSYYRLGYSLGVFTKNKVATSTTPYLDSSDHEVQEITVPDCQPIMLPSPTDYSERITTYFNGQTLSEYNYVPTLYVGKGNPLHTDIIQLDTTEEISNIDTDNDIDYRQPILAIIYDANALGYLHGTISNHNIIGTRLWDHSLCYFGPDGLFERFYRTLDNLLRNSLHKVTATLLLTPQQKNNIPAHEKIIIQGQELLIDKLKYKIGSANKPIQSDMLTTHLYEPIDTATPESNHTQQPSLTWKRMFTYTILTSQQYNESPYKDKTYPVTYPPHPTAIGETTAQQLIAKAVLTNGGRDTEYRLYTYYLISVTK